MIIDKYIFSSKGGYEINEDCADCAVYENGAAFVLADGLGGHGNGDVASKFIVDYLTKALNGADETIDEAVLCRKIEDANAALYELKIEKALRMKSTVAALYLNDHGAVWANVGDSRVYYIHNNHIESVTADHSVAYKKYLAGEISRAEIGSDEDQSSLLRSLGNEECSKIDSYSAAPIDDKDAFFLCSDGFWENVADEEILFDYLKADSAQTWAEQLLLKVKKRMPADNDNLSFICVIK